MSDSWWPHGLQPTRLFCLWDFPGKSTGVGCHRLLCHSESYGFSSRQVWMWGLEYKESWVPKNWCFSTLVLEKTLESPLDCKEIQPLHSEGDQSWVFFGRTDAKAETPVLWPPHVKSWLIGKDSDAGRDWGQEEKGMTEDEMAGWHQRFDGQEFRWTLGVGDRQGGLVCCDSWGCKESDTTKWLNWTELKRVSTHAQHKEPRKKSKELNTFPSLLEGNGEYVVGHSCKTFSDA